MTRLSVALCTYNGRPYIAEQLLSILDQRPAASQLVVSDDGSDDGTVAVVRETIASRDDVPELVVLEGDAPTGVTANFERAIAAADGDLVALSDQDDRWHPGRLRTITERFAADPSLTFLHTDAALVDENGVALGRTLFESLEVSPAEFRAERSGDAFRVLLRRNLATGATAVFRRDLVERAMPFPPEWVHDEWLAIIASVTGRVDVLEEPTIDYRLHGSNLIGVAEPTFRYKVSRVLQNRGDRNLMLARRFAVLADRLAELGDAVPEGVLEHARAKAAFEAERAALPGNRLKRVRAVLALWRRGLYVQYASRGTADVLRDLFQPA
ncbi:glycosyltransferase family 2 protein [Leifsonia poae]|uniref:Glycosyl transferase n=1 Tax=Leifsonia poae TaxID=110933 RepID=A0A9W6H7W5_9MICO|nr:glycosyltransferase family 2 protein [Leifsonia poae]GLJ75575.1 glycosyl transferase [Leifsonia poae]